MQHVHVENITSQQVGARIADVRGHMKMTQAELASEMSARLGREIRPLTVTRLEGGKRPIGVDELIAAAEALKIKPADLLSDSNLSQGSVLILGAYQEVIRSTNLLQSAARQWVSSHQRLNDVLNEMDEKHFDRLPTVTRMEISSVRDWTAQACVDDALNNGDDDDSEA